MVHGNSGAYQRKHIAGKVKVGIGLVTKG